MFPLIEAIAALGTTLFANAARRAAARVAGLLLAASLLLASLGFFSLAGYRALAQAIGDIYAPLIIGGAYLIAALTALLIVQSRR